MTRTLLLAAALALVGVPAAGQPMPDIFTEPPREAFGLDLVLAYEDRLVTVIQGESAIRDACGIAFACLSWVQLAADTDDDEVCQLHIWTGLPDDLEELARRNLIARCGGWVPAGE